jgi:hypothetical protein
MVDTAQPLAAETDPNVQLENAADAFKAFTTEQPIERPRDDRGRFAPADTDEDEIEAEGNELEAENGEETADDEEQPEEAQPDAVDMPSSWSKEDADLWQTLPPEAQAKIAEREGERDRAVNQKFQEAANVRKAVESQLTEANANRDRFAAAIDEVMSLVMPQRPDPRAFGAGTGAYNREAYDLALVEYEQQSQILNALRQQREAISAQQTAEAEQAAKAARETVEETWKPKLIELMPDLTDPAKGGQVLSKLVDYAVQSGIEPELFQNPQAASQITSAELLILEKARRFDELQAAKGKVRETPAPKPATPTVKPGVVTSRSAQRASQHQKAVSRLAKEGSIEAGAAVFRNFL